MMSANLFAWKDLPSSGENTFLNGSDCHEAKDTNFVCLTDAVSTILGLQILMGIPIRVKDNNSVSGLQVETKTSGSGR